MNRMTYREYKMRLAWMDMQWEMPNRSDHYLMQIAQYLEAIWLRKRSLGDFARYIIPFKSVPKEKAQKDEATKRKETSKRTWSTMLGSKKNGRGTRS